MPPLWSPEEAESKVYREVEKHSEGMISFTYRPPSKADLDALKNTETYRSLMCERAGLPPGSEPQGNPPAGDL